MNEGERIKKATERLEKDLADYDKLVESGKRTDFGTDLFYAIYERNTLGGAKDIDVFGLIRDSIRIGFMAGQRFEKRSRRK